MPRLSQFSSFTKIDVKRRAVEKKLLSVPFVRSAWNGRQTRFAINVKTYSAVDKLVPNAVIPYVFCFRRALNMCWL